MIKKTMTYTDYNGVERTEDFYFNLSKAELMEMHLTVTGGFETLVRNMINAQDLPSLIALFKDVLLKAYGKKSPDGRRFIKSPELSAEFSQTEAYSDLYMLLVTDDKEAAKFINGVMPSDLAEKASAQNMLASAN